MRVASFNIHHGVGADGRLDLDRTAATLRATGAQLIGLQEVDRNWSPRSGLVDQADALGRALGMHVAFGAALDRPPDPPGGPRRRYGNAVLSAAPITAAEWTLLPGRPGAEPRGLLDVAVALEGVEVRFACTHLDPRSARLRGRQVRAALERLGGAGRPSMLVGDLNAVPGSRELHPLSVSLTDAWAAGTGSGATFPARRPRRRIDHIWVSPTWSVGHAAVVDSLASDHLAVVAELSAGEPDSA